MTDKIQKIEAAITPMTLIQSAQAEGVSVEKMQQLFELQMKWEASEAKKAYNDAIAEFKSANIKIYKNAEVKYANTNYKHSSLDHVVNTVVPILARHGLTHSWETRQDQGRVEVSCKVSHRLGHSESITLSAPADTSGSKNTIQAIGSTITYLQRYTLMSILGLSSGDADDDGQQSEQPRVETITASQAADIAALINEVRANEKQFCAYYGVDAVYNLPAAKFKSAVAALEKKRGKK